MSRIHLVQPEEATGNASELLSAVKAGMGMVPNLTKVMANAPGVLQQYLSSHEALESGQLAATEREQIALRVAELNECHYCLSAHCAIGKMKGLDGEEIIQNRGGTSGTGRSQAILNLATAIVNERGRVSDEDLEGAREAGLSDSEIVEVVGHVAQNILTNYLNNVAQTVIDFPKVAPLEAAATA